MPESIQPGPVCDTVGIREAVCIHTRKIFDSCRDQDCIEDLRVYPTTSSQAILDRAVSVKARRAELLRASPPTLSWGPPGPWRWWAWRCLTSG